MTEPGTEVEQRAALSPAELQAAEAEAAAITAATPSKPTLPVVKLAQQLTKEVESGDAKAGQFLNTLTGRNYGDSLSLVVAYPTVRGRFFAEKKGGQSYATLAEVAPPQWPEQYAGRRFDELADAEEVYRVEHEQDWGDGPPISTTLNFIGFTPDDPTIPLRLSLMRTAMPAARKIDNILRWAVKAPWHNVIELTTQRKTNADEQPYYVPVATQGRETTPEEQSAAVELFTIIRNNLGEVTLVGDADEGAEAKAAKRASAEKSDGLAVA